MHTLGTIHTMRVTYLSTIFLCTITFNPQGTLSIPRKIHAGVGHKAIKRQSDGNKTVEAVEDGENKIKNATTSGNVTIISLPKAKASFVESIVQCMPILKYCQLLGLAASCPLTCLLDPFPTSRALIQVVLYEIIPLLCMPIGSTYNGQISGLFDAGGRIRTPFKYNELAEGNSNPSISSSHVPYALIKYGNAPILDALKPVTGTLGAVINNVLPVFFTNFHPQNNPACERKVNFWPTAAVLADVMIRNPSTSDLALPGWFVVMNLFNQRVGYLDNVIQAMRYMMKLFVGVECGLVQYAQEGAGAVCKEVLGSLREEPTAVTSVVNEEFVCGKYPDLPFIDLSDIFTTNSTNANITNTK